MFYQILSHRTDVRQLFSALYSMLPSSKKYLIMSGFSPSAAAWILLAGFTGGFVGIQIISRFLHHYIPSHVVDCDHSHDEVAHEHSHGKSRTHSHTSHNGSHRGHNHKANGLVSEATPLLPSENGSSAKLSPQHAPTRTDLLAPRRNTEAADRRPSMIQVQNRVMSFVKDTKTNCDNNGPCFGYSDPCGQECFKHINIKTPSTSRQPTFIRANTSPLCREHAAQAEATSEAQSATSSTRSTFSHSRLESDEACESDEEDLEAQHHHHVPENAFMSIGLQTSIAIALHKLPEGFITYATNHANPSLGFSVFMALFVHNITEGFAMALPLFLALNSRFRAMFWASLLGGVSQPLGAAIAAAWFKIAGHEGHKPGEEVYGVMFAITAGIMTSVAMQLFVESLTLNHNRNMCIAFGFIGMAIMGMSNALTS